MHRVNQKDLNGILHQLNLYAEQLEQQMTAQEFFDKKQRNRLIAKKDELYRYRRAYQASIEPLSRISMDDGVKAVSYTHLPDVQIPCLEKFDLHV